MKYQEKQKRKQRSCFRALQQEKRLVKLMHEKVFFRKFDLYPTPELIVMYNNIIDDKVVYESLDSTNKKLYNECKKYVMFNDIKTLSEIEHEKQSVHDQMTHSKDEYNFERLKKKYRDLCDEYQEFRKKLTDTVENRRMFNMCNSVMTLDY